MKNTLHLFSLLDVAWGGDGHAEGSMSEHSEGGKKERIRDARKREETTSVLVGVPLRRGKKKKKNPGDTVPSLRVRRQQAAVVLHEYGHYVKESPSIDTDEEHPVPRWRSRAHNALEMMKSSPGCERKQLIVNGYGTGTRLKEKEKSSTS
jgi:hypothetical protein